MPKIVDHEEMREMVAAAVWRVLARDGTQAMTVRSIAAEAGCSTGTLAHYFHNKDELLLFAFRSAFERGAARVESHLELTPKREALLAVLLEVMPLDTERRREQAVWISYWSAVVGNPELAEEQIKRHRTWRHQILQLVSEAQVDGSLRDDIDPEETAERLVALSDGLAVHSLFDPSRLDSRRVSEIIDRQLDDLSPA